MKSWPKVKTHYFKHVSGKITTTRNPLIAAALAANPKFKYLYTLKSFVVETEKTLTAARFSQYPYSEKQRAQEVPSKQGAADVIALVVLCAICALA